MIAPPAPAPAGVRRRRTPPELPWLPALLVGAAVLLASTPVAAVVQGASWFGHAAAAVTLVMAVGLLAFRFGAVAVASGQLAVLLILLTALFCEDGLLGVLPGPGALGEMGTLLSGAVTQIQVVPAPVPATREILFLATLALGLIAVAAHLAAVTAAAPATAGVPLLVAFAVPTALADDLLPWWTLVAGAGAFGLLMVVGSDRRRLPGAAAVTAGAIVVALLVGLVTTAVGTDGRFADAPRAGGADIGLDPFTALRGELTRTAPEELLEVRGLPRATYLRALTLRDYVPDTGWAAGRPDPGVPLTGLLPPPDPGERATVEIDNLAYRDYWLPLYGSPVNVAGVDEDLWAYDPVSGTAYASRPRAESSWEQQASLPTPTAAQLRAAGRGGVAPAYLDASGVDPRVAALTAQITAGATTDFDRAIALLDHFTAPNSQFAYSLSTAPGNGDDALVEFLTVGRVGYCEQFASAMAIMLRSQGVPARVAIGFTAGTPTDDYRTISTTDAHAWVEVWFSGIGWTLFDPTPLTDARTVQPPYVEEARDRSGPVSPPAATPQPPTPEAVPVPGQVAPPLAGSDAGAGTENTGWFDDRPLWPFVTLLVALVVALVVAAPGTRRRLDRRRRLASVDAGGPGAASAAWSELLAESMDRGVPGQRSDTVRATARRIVREHGLDDGSQAALRQVVGAVESSWYGDEHPEPGRLTAPLTQLTNGIEAGDPIGWRRCLLPSSVVAHARGSLRRAKAPPVTPARSGGGIAPPSAR